MIEPRQPVEEPTGRTHWFYHHCEERSKFQVLFEIVRVFRKSGLKFEEVAAWSCFDIVRLTAILYNNAVPATWSSLYDVLLRLCTFRMVQSLN